MDAAKNFIDASMAEAREAGVPNARFFVADVQGDDLGGPYDAAFSRMGTMFFISPVAALRNVRKSLVPGGRLTSVVWRRREDNEWLYKAQQVVEGMWSGRMSTTTRPAAPGRSRWRTPTRPPTS